MARVAIVTDSAADLDPASASALGITVVPLIVNFGSTSYRAGVDLSAEAFWERMTAPEALFPTTAASSPGTFREVFEGCFAAGADALVCVDVGSTLSGTFKSAQIARELLPEREIYLVDSESASMGVGLLAMLGAQLAVEGVPADAIARTLEIRVSDIDVIVVLDTLEYLVKETPVWVEVTTLLIPGQNDSEDEVARLSEWLVEHLGPSVPLHFSAFHPDFTMLDVPPTPLATLRRARAQALSAGLHHVYTGNVHDPEGHTTFCAGCGAVLIRRDWYQLLEYRLGADGRCPDCGSPLAGHFAATADTHSLR